MLHVTYNLFQLNICLPDKLSPHLDLIAQGVIFSVDIDGVYQDCTSRITDYILGSQ